MVWALFFLKITISEGHLINFTHQTSQFRPNLQVALMEEETKENHSEEPTSSTFYGDSPETSQNESVRPVSVKEQLEIFHLRALLCFASCGVILSRERYPKTCPRSPALRYQGPPQPCCSRRGPQTTHQT